MSSHKNNISDKTGLFNPKVKAEILSKIESLLAKGDRERLTAWFFEEQSLVREDIQFPGFLELDQFLGIFLRPWLLLCCIPTRLLQTPSSSEVLRKFVSSDRRSTISGRNSALHFVSSGIIQ